MWPQKLARVEQWNKIGAETKYSQPRMSKRRMLHVNIGSKGIVGRVCSVSTNIRTLLRTDRQIMSKPTVIRGAEAGVNFIHPDQPRVGGRPHLLTESGIWQTLEDREGQGDRTGAGTNGEMEVGTLMRSWVVYQKSFINDV